MEAELFAQLKETIDQEVVIGSPKKVEGLTLIPILDLLLGGGIKDESVAGGGVSLRARAIIVIDRGEISYLSLKDSVLAAEIKQRLPEVLSKIEKL